MVFLLVSLTVLHLVTLAMLLIATLEKVSHTLNRYHTLCCCLSHIKQNLLGYISRLSDYMKISS